MRLVPILLGTISSAVTLMAADWAGTWKLNLEKSKIQNSTRPYAGLASETMTISETGPNSYTTTIDTVSKSGEQRHREILRINDGKEHPAKGVGVKTEGVTEISQQVNASTHKITQKRDGKVLDELTSVVSPDGKVMTNRWTNGDVLVFERQ